MSWMRTRVASVGPMLGLYEAVVGVASKGPGLGLVPVSAWSRSRVVRAAIAWTTLHPWTTLAKTVYPPLRVSRAPLFWRLMIQRLDVVVLLSGTMARVRSRLDREKPLGMTGSAVMVRRPDPSLNL